MRLHTLSLRAVGPFADPQVVDFDRLGSGGLFLFEGPTGVGKSTILDALTFALYGGLASDASDPARMRSDFADPDVRPEVVLEFSVRGARFRVMRSPEHQRPKRRGSGFTVERASVHLERREGSGWTSLSHSKEEVGTLVTDLVGLSRDQFRQVVLLPQGEFATFLRSDDDRRREVLMKLFGTQFFRRVTDQLQARAQAARLAMAEADTDLAARIAAAWEAAGQAPDDALMTGTASMVQRVAQVGELADGLQRAAADTARSAEEGDALVAAARSEHAAAMESRDRVARWDALAGALAALDADRAAHEERVARLAAARRAAPIRPLVELQAESAAQVVAAQAQLDAVGGLSTLAEEVTGEALTAMAEQLRVTALGLAGTAALEEALPHRRRDLSARRGELARAEGERDLCEQQLQQLPQQATEAQAALDGARALVARREALVGRRSSLVERAAAAGRVEELGVRVAGAREAQRACRRALDEARHSVELLTEHRLAGLRGELAGRLVSGDPCLVCGSCEHPAPAEVRTTGVTEDALRAAIAQRDQAHLELEAAELACARAEGELQAAQDATGSASLAEVTNELAQVETALAEVSSVEAAIGALVERVERLSAQSASTVARLVELTSAHSAAAAAVGSLAREVEGAEADVVEARNGFPSVAARIADLERRAEAATRRAAALARLADAQAECARVSGRIDVEARSAGFADAQEAQAALLPRDELEALAAAVELWHSQRESIRGQMADPDLAGAAALDRGSVEGAVHAAGEAVAAREAAAAEARRVAAVAAQRWDRFTQRLAEVEQAVADRADLAERNDEIIALDQYARGMAGSPRMTLVTYVLRYWFEQVVAAANVRLAEMSAGKYQLVRIDESSRRDARVGLGLAVLDRHTGRERSPSTLSGGETFYTSLSLALGLADVVVAQAGGAQLDTLFIDEGFGSLDPDTLDDVMAVIDELRGNGRVVGIVSHVPDLKERISERLSVRRIRPDGPSQVHVLA